MKKLLLTILCLILATSPAGAIKLKGDNASQDSTSRISNDPCHGC